MVWIASSYSEQTAMRLARAGAQIRILCQDDACAVCKAFSGRTYAPAEVPHLPIPGCTNATCRCRFVAVDPASGLTVEEMLQQGIQAVRQKDTTRARRLLRRVVELDELNEPAWLWLSGVVDDREKVACLEKVLAINPHNQNARAGLEYIHRKLSALSAAEAAPPQPESAAIGASPRPPADKGPAGPGQAEVASPTWPAQVIETRQERQVIIDQWKEFLAIAVETDPNILLMQGSAFLKQLARLNRQALAGLSGPQRLQELEVQWRESEAIGEPLADLLHATDHAGRADWELIFASLRQLAQKILEHRKMLREQIAAEGGIIP